ncbi:MAG: hypothetical protein V3Q69_10505 [Burkholderia sp.]
MTPTRTATSVACNPFVSLEIISVDAIASSRSIYVTTPLTLQGVGLYLERWNFTPPKPLKPV